MSEKKMIRYGVVGIGGIARGVHIPGIMRSPDAELVAVCDIVPEKLEWAKKEYHIADDHAFTDYRELLRSGLIDAVSICTPNDVHVEVAREAVRCHIPFAVEKPLSVDAPTAKPLVEELEASPVPNMICFSYRFRPAARYARDLIAQGRIGTIRHVYTRYLQGWGNPLKDCPRVWRFDHKQSGSGTLADLGSHMLDLVHFLTGDTYARFVAQNGTFMHERRSIDPAKNGALEKVDVDDYAHYLAVTKGGIAASFEISRNGFGRGNFQHIEIYGDKGALIYELENGDFLEICEGADENSHTFRRMEIPQQYFVDQMQSFIDRIHGNERGLCADVFDGYADMLELDAIIRSSDEGVAVTM